MEYMWFGLLCFKIKLVIKKKKKKPFDWIQTSSEASLHRKRHCIINKPSQSVLVDFFEKRKMNPNKSHSSLNSGSTDGRTG